MTVNKIKNTVNYSHVIYDRKAFMNCIIMFHIIHTYETRTIIFLQNPFSLHNKQTKTYYNVLVTLLQLVYDYIA